jgi:hypothetical protein
MGKLRNEEIRKRGNGEMEKWEIGKFHYCPVISQTAQAG